VPDATAGTVKTIDTTMVKTGGDVDHWSRSPSGSRSPMSSSIRMRSLWQREYAEDLKQIPLFQQILDPDTHDGSNLWAVAGKLTTTGNSMIANDPHLSLQLPTTFYPIGIAGQRINAVGVGFPGAPLVVQGHNENIAWGSTVNPMDVTDAYQEQVIPDATSPSGFSSLYKGAKEFLAPLPQVFRANNVGNGTPNDITVVPPSASIPPATLIVSRRNAPIVSLDTTTGAAVSIQWVGHGPTRELETFLVWNEAKNLDDFKRAGVLRRRLAELDLHRPRRQHRVLHER
jgi:penicillin amidase